MSHSDYLQNYQMDLERAKLTPLLIELSQDDIAALSPGLSAPQQQFVPSIIAQSVFNGNQSEKLSNILVIDGDVNYSENTFVLLDSLLDQLRHELKSIKNLTTLKESLKVAAAVASGGLLNDLVSDHLDKGLDFIFDEVGGQFSSMLSDIVIDNIDVSKHVLSSIEDFLHDTTGENLGEALNRLTEQKISLSSSAKSELDQLSNTFSQSQKFDVFQVTFKLLLAIALDGPKLIYINNPHKLDDNSLGMLSLLFSFAKNQKELEKHIGLSAVYTYSDTEFHLYDEVEPTLQGKQQLLADQRRFIQRYAMLERPGSDIPTIAVKSSLFIGRDEELATLDKHFTKRLPTTLSVISGEPGVGKTALVNQHVDAIKKQSGAIVLTIFNEVGNNSNNTGLSALEKSIIDEAKRLEQLTNWKEKGLNFVKNIGTKENAFKALGVLFSGADKALSVADAGYQRVKLEDNLNGLKQHGMGDLNNKQADEKERQFTKFDKAIHMLQGITSSPLPIVLFIDDLQWIDDVASEYILSRLLQQPDVYIIATIRPSDAATQFKQWRTHADLYRYSLTLLKAAKVKGSQDFNYEAAISTLNSKVLALQGFDKTALTQLITNVIRGTRQQQLLLTESIFTALSSGGEQQVNTLFAVETINMLCDKKLYSENTFERLILDSPLRFNPDLIAIESALEITFSTLQSKYQDSLAHVSQSSNGQSFNLMAYAVLEERLHLLKKYFGEQGNAAVNTLLFSSLLGAPFSSDLVKKVMLAVTKTNVPELSPLKGHLIGNQSDALLRPEHYVIIDEVYEILRRLPATDDKYRYRHGLLHTFLDKQFDYLLESVFIENRLNAKDQLIKLIQWQVTRSDGYKSKHEAKYGEFTTTQLEEIEFFYDALLHVLAKGYSFNPNKWADILVTDLENIAHHYARQNKATKAIQLTEQALAICEKYIKDDPYEEWEEYYIDNLNNLALFYEQINRVDEAIIIYEKILAIYGVQRDELLSSKFVDEVSNLANAYWKVNRCEEAMIWFEQVLAIREKQFPKEKNYRTYLPNLIQMSSCYRQLKRFNRASQLAEEALILSQERYLVRPTVFASEYINSLINLAFCYVKNDQVSESILLNERAVELSRVGYATSPDMWAMSFADSLSGLAHSYKQNQQISESVTVEKEALSIIEHYYNIEPDVWAKHYTSSLNSLANVYTVNDQVEYAIALGKKALAIDEYYYGKLSEVWAKNYTSTLKNIAISYKNLKRIDEAIVLEQKALSICEYYYVKAPVIWSESYVACINGLADSFRLDDQEESALEIEAKVVLLRAESGDTRSLEADNEDRISKNNGFASYFKEASTVSDGIPFQEKAVEIFAGYYNAAPSLWDYIYVYSLEELAASYEKNKQLSEATSIKETVVEVCRLAHARDPDDFAEQYISGLSDLARSYVHNGQVSKGISLEEQSMELCADYYIQDSDKWGLTYTNHINKLSQYYRKNSQGKKAAELAERAITLYECLFASDPDRWASDYVASIDALASLYLEESQISAAIVVLEKGLMICKEYYTKRPFIWSETYTAQINTLSHCFRSNRQIREAKTLEKIAAIIEAGKYAHPTDISNYEEALSLMVNAEKAPIKEAVKLGGKAVAILEEYYSYSSKGWAYDYTQSLIRLAAYFEGDGNLNKTIELQTKALTICEPYYNDVADVWADNYASCLINLANSYKQNNYVREAIELEEKALDVCASYYKKSSDAWAEKYATCLASLAYSYKTTNQEIDALQLEEKAVAIWEKYYRQSPQQWAESYTKGMVNLACSYQQNNQIEGASQLEEKVLVVCEAYFNSGDKSEQESFWAETYTKTLVSLARYYADRNELNKAIAYQEKTLPIYKQYSSVSIWRERHVNSLATLAVYCKKNNQMSKVIKFELDALDVYRKLFSDATLVWSERYINVLHRLANHLEDFGGYDCDKQTVYSQMCNVYKTLYQQSSKKWREDYLYSLYSYASFYLEVRDYRGAYEYFKQYFDIFSYEVIDDVEHITEFVFSLVKYVQASSHLSTPECADFKKLADNFNRKMTEQFSSAYREQVCLLLNGSEKFSGYIHFSESNESFEKEKYQIFVEYFVNK